MILATGGATDVPLGCRLQSGKIAKFAKCQNASLSIFKSTAYFAKQKFLRHEVSTKFAYLQAFGHRSQIESADGSRVLLALIFAIFQNPIFLIFSTFLET